jgi:hypothetical protein
MWKFGANTFLASSLLLSHGILAQTPENVDKEINASYNIQKITTQTSTLVNNIISFSPKADIHNRPTIVEVEKIPWTKSEFSFDLTTNTVALGYSIPTKDIFPCSTSSLQLEFKRNTENSTGGKVGDNLLIKAKVYF